MAEMTTAECITRGTHLEEVNDDGYCYFCGDDQGQASLRIGGVEYSKTAGDGPPDQVQVKFSEDVTVTVYVQGGKYVVVEIDGEVDGEELAVPFRVYRNDGMLWQEGAGLEDQDGWECPGCRKVVEPSDVRRHAAECDKYDGPSF